MPTKKQRINISVSDEITNTLENLALRDQVPVATKALQLIQIALQIEEDDALDIIASSRDKKSSRYIPHKLAWK